jgi:hypothetical protein
MIYTIDGQRYEVQDAKELVSQMRDAHMTPFTSDAEFMRHSAKKAEEQSGQKVRVSSPEAFVEDLLIAGLLKVEKKEGDDIDGDDYDDRAEHQARR